MESYPSGMFDMPRVFRINNWDVEGGRCVLELVSELCGLLERVEVESWLMEIMYDIYNNNNNNV